MKKIVTVEDLMIALVAAAGYGLSFEIPKISGFPEWQCIVICLVTGTAVELAANKIIFSEDVQKKTSCRLTAFAILVCIFFAAGYAADILGIEILNYVEEQYQFVIIPPLVIFAFNVALRQYRIKKIRERYGDGSDGFVFDDVKQSDIDDWNKQNRQIHGEYDDKFAVKTRTGVFVGNKVKNTIFFTGIPYAKPPVDKLRWQAPEPLPDSDNVFEAKEFGASAIQVDYEGSFLQHHRQSEDCLYLNICIGTKKTNKKKPVIVIFHHGDFSHGGAADPLMAGENFMKIYPDSIGVTFNYRIGIFGFIDFSEIPGGEKCPDALNLGLLDQIAALRWIKENISSFGGDPEQITVMGFEAGALSILLLSASEQAKGLYQKAFIFHSTPLDAYETPDVSKKLAKKLLRETSAKTMEELLQIPAERLKEAQQKLVNDLSAPTRDGKLIPIDVYEAYRQGSVAGVEFMIGIARNEVQIYKSFVGEQKYKDFVSKELNSILKYIYDDYPGEAETVKAYVEEKRASLPESEADGELFEELYALSVYDCAKELSDGGNKVRLFYWNVKPLIENLGSGTVDVMAAFLGSREALQIYGNVLNKDIAETFQNLFRKFESGEELRLHNNEIKGVGAIDWQEFPQALVISEKGFKCEPITDKLTDVKALSNIFMK